MTSRHSRLTLPALTLALALPALTGTALAGTENGRSGCELHTAGAAAGGIATGVELPARAGKGPDREAKVALETPFVKLAVLTLRNGFVLPAHDAPVPVTIQALSGKGEVRAGETILPLDPQHMVVLPPKVSHEVAPEKGGELVILIHYVKPAAASSAAPAAEGDTHEH